MSSGIGGKRLVVGLYLGIVCFTGVAGYLTASVVDEITPPRFLFLIEFPATAFGLAAYGALTIALILGVLLGLVTVVSERIDDASPGTDDDVERAGDDVEHAGDGVEPAGDEGTDELPD
nr:cox cluster protein [Halonotius terrestris]